MLGLDFVRRNPELVKADLVKRKKPALAAKVDLLLKYDRIWKALKQQLEAARHRKNELSLEINKLKKAGKDISAKLKEAKALLSKIGKLERATEKAYLKVKEILARLPNIMLSDVPDGLSEDDNVEIKRWGKKKRFSFKPLSHVDLLERLGVADIPRAAKVAGSRFYYLKNQLVLLDMALQRFALDFLAKKGFTFLLTPFMLRRHFYEGVTDLADFENQLYKIEGEDLFLIATSEHTLAAYHANELIDGEKLPLRYAGLSSCFRREAGAHGKDTKGIFRVHQFNKVEQFVFCKPEQSSDIHEELLDNAEKLLQALEIPYRVVIICSGQLGDVAAKKYDIEAWMPAQKRYRELISCSNCTDYQARGLNIKYIENGKRNYVHTLNSTAIATQRTIVAILENNQRADGSVKIPNVLRKYVGFDRIGLPG